MGGKKELRQGGPESVGNVRFGGTQLGGSEKGGYKKTREEKKAGKAPNLAELIDGGGGIAKKKRLCVREHRAMRTERRGEKVGSFGNAQRHTEQSKGQVA